MQIIGKLLNYNIMYESKRKEQGGYSCSIHVQTVWRIFATLGATHHRVATLIYHYAMYRCKSLSIKSITLQCNAFAKLIKVLSLTQLTL